MQLANTYTETRRLESIIDGSMGGAGRWRVGVHTHDWRCKLSVLRLCFPVCTWIQRRRDGANFSVLCTWDEAVPHATAALSVYAGTITTNGCPSARNSPAGCTTSMETALRVRKVLTLLGTHEAIVFCSFFHSFIHSSFLPGHTHLPLTDDKHTDCMQEAPMRWTGMSLPRRSSSTLC